MTKSGKNSSPSATARGDCYDDGAPYIEKKNAVTKKTPHPTVRTGRLFITYV